MKPNVWKVLSDDEVQKVHDTSLEILHKTGVIIQNEGVLQRLKQEGATVELSRQAARMPEELLDEALRSAPKRSRVVLYDRESNPSVRCGTGKLYGASGNDAVYVLNSDTGERRPATKRDVGEFAKLADALGNVHMISPQAVPQDVPPGSAMLHAVAAILSNSTKHILVAVRNGAEARGVIEISESVLEGKKLADYPIVSFMVSPTSPLRWEAAAVEVLIEGSKSGFMHDVLSEPVCGVTAPITLAGYLVVQNAEFLTGLLISQLINKGTPVMYGCGPTAMDMKEAWPLTGSAETMILRVASGQMAKFYDLPSRTNGEADSQCMDEQNCWERVLQDMAAVCSDMDLVITQGQFGTGMTVSHEQLVIDDEILGLMNRIKDGISVSVETLAKDLIAKVGPGGQFLREMHTHRHLKSEHLTDMISNRSSYGRWAERGRMDIVAIAKARAKRLLMEHKPKELAGDISLRIARTVDHYDKILNK